MNTLREQEEEEHKPANEESDSSPTTSELPSRSRRPSAFWFDARKQSDPKSDNGKNERRLEIPQIVETQATPRTHRKHSTFDTVLQVLRRPSAATLEAFRHSGSRRGSHVNFDTGRRSSPSGSVEMQIIAQNVSDNGIQRINRGTIVPTNHVSFRRPSGIVTFNPDMMNSHQRRYIMGLLRDNGGSTLSLPSNEHEHPRKKLKLKQCKDGNDAFVTILSAFYAKFLIIIGISFPVTEVLSEKVSAHYYQGFYLYLYLGSLGFMTFMYMTLLKNRAITQLLKSSLDVADGELQRIQNKRFKRASSRIFRYGSFYLRLGAVAFGIGSMVYSGLEFGQYFEIENEDCQNLVQAVTPITRMILTLVQMQFIFLNSRQMEMSRYRGIARFGLMHMIATNLCEWLYVIVEETKHEIIHIKEHSKSHDSKHYIERDERSSVVHDIFECKRGNVMGSLVQDASPFLFPCTIEYSLICAVIMYEMWKTVKNVEESEEEEKELLSRQTSKSSEDVGKANNHFTVDCSNAHKGLFSGILLLVITIISLIMFFVMIKDSSYQNLASNQVHVWEVIMYVLTGTLVIYGGWHMSFLKYKLSRRKEGIGLDNMLLVWAQSGIYIYCMFSAIACYFMMPLTTLTELFTEILNLIQSTIQTVFILDATFRRTTTTEQNRHKPGRQIITFTLVSNMALWLINTLHKSRAEFRPHHSVFYGVWAWTIITHVSMPLAIFFRFHSTICLFEVWKNAYKFKHEQVSLLGNTMANSLD